MNNESKQLRTPLALKNISNIKNNTPNLIGSKSTKLNMVFNKLELCSDNSEVDDENFNHSHCKFDIIDIPIKEIHFGEIDEDTTISHEEERENLPDEIFMTITEKDLINNMKIQKWLDEGLFYTEFN